MTTRRQLALSVLVLAGGLVACATGRAAPAEVEPEPAPLPGAVPVSLPSSADAALPVKCRRAPRAVDRAPAGFPSEVRLPPDAPGAWVTRREVARHADGRTEPIALVYELRSRTAPVAAARRHFVKTLRGWDGGFQPAGTGEVGRFTRGDLTVEVTLEGEGGLTLIVRAPPICPER